MPVVRRALVAGALLAIGGVAAPGTAGAMPPDAPEGPETAPITAVAPDGVAIRAWATTAGDEAPTLIVVNGGPGFSHAAAPPAESLAPGFRVVTYDQRGTGQSGRSTDAAFDLDHQVADLEALRRRLHVSRVDLLGHSWGGAIAAAYAAAHPRRVTALVLADALPLDAALDDQGAQAQNRRFVQLIQSGAIHLPLPPLQGDDCTAIVNAEAPVVVADPGFPVPALPPGTCSVSTQAATQAATGAQALAAARAALAGYHGRALVVFGAADVFQPFWAAADAAQLSSAEVTTRTLPMAGHDLWLEAPQFFPLVRRFLEEADSDRGD